MRVCEVLLHLLSVPPQPRNLNQPVHNLQELACSRKPDFKVISLSEALPPQSAERKLTAPAGVNPFVLWDL